MNLPIFIKAESITFADVRWNPKSLENMTVKRVLISLACLMTTTLFAVGQVAVKTNVAMDALAIPNAGIEVGLSKKLTLDVPVYYNPWESVMWKNHHSKKGQNKKWENLPPGRTAPDAPAF